MSTSSNRSFVAGMAARYGGRLKRFLKLNLSNASDVPDLAQEIFLRLLRVPNPQDIRSPEAYLFTIASHVVQQHGQKQANVPESLDLMESLGSLPIVSEDDPTDQVAFMQRLSSLQSLLNQLPPRVAMALIMHRLVGHSIADIARELGVAEVTVKKYLARALVHCRLAAVDGSTLKQSDSSLMADRSLEGKL